MPQQSEGTRHLVRLTGATRDGIFEELAGRKSWLHLATPYFSVECRLLAREGNTLLLRVHLSREALVHALGHHPLALRFPWNLSIYKGPTHLLEVRTDDAHKRVAVVELPEYVHADERRTQFRVERTGRSRATVLLPGGRLLRASLEDISQGGTCLYSQDSLGRDELYTGMPLSLEVDLEGGASFKAQARVCHVDGYRFGLAFHPPLDPLASSDLERWIQPRRREAQRMWDNRMELRAEAEQAAAQAQVQPKGALLISGDAALAESLRPTLEALGELRTALASVGAVKRLLSAPPLVAILELPQVDTETRRRMRQMVEALALPCPLVIVGRGQDPEAGRTFANELKAALYFDWTPDKAVFAQRLVQGFLRRMAGPA